jgi:probable rRNA maturation factor
MTIELDIQCESTTSSLPDNASFQSWVNEVLRDHDQAQLTIRLVDEEESAGLNFQYRSKKGATNVLSFPADLPAVVDLPLLGDIVICGPLVEREAREQGKGLQAHWAHLVIHGVLHLLGFDHQFQEQAQVMESREIFHLNALGFSDPYQLIQ